MRISHGSGRTPGDELGEVDNLYLDMNGIIHPCCHPEGGKPQPGSEAEMFENVAKLLDTLVEKLRPRKLLCAAAARTSASHRLLP